MKAKQTEYGVTYSNYNYDHGYPQIHRYTWIISTDGENENEVLKWANDNLIKKPHYSLEQWEEMKKRTPTYSIVHELDEGFYQIKKHSENEWEYTVGYQDPGCDVILPINPRIEGTEDYDEYPDLLKVMDKIYRLGHTDDPFKRISTWLSPEIWTTEKARKATKDQMDFAYKQGVSYVLHQIAFFLDHRRTRK